MSTSAPLQKNVGITTATRIAQAILRHKELAATLILVIHLYVDWYLGLAFSAQLLTFGFILLCYWQRSELPWTKPRALWLWFVFLALALLPAVRALSLKDSLYYYVNTFLNALLVFWLGLLVVRDVASARRLFSMLAFLGALLAIHTIIQARTGVLLFKTTRYDTSLDSLLHFELGRTGIFRAESFLLNPDSNGALFALLFFLPLGLFVSSSSYRARAFYLVEMALMLPALLFTYSTGAWLALGAGVLCFLIFVGRMSPRIQIVVLIVAAILILVLGFPRQFHLLLQHATASDELSLRLGVWQTALRVIAAFPLLGMGLGRYIYIVKSAPYRVPAQFIPVYHPHNSYLEVATLGGIPLGLIFVALLGLACWLALRNWQRSARSDRALLAGGLSAICSLSFYSLSNAGWTLTPLLAASWLILGGLASPFLVQMAQREGAGTGLAGSVQRFNRFSLAEGEKAPTEEEAPGTEVPGGEEKALGERQAPDAEVLMHEGEAGEP